MTDNCNTTKNGRRKYEAKSGVQAVGCSSHEANGMNKGVFELEENAPTQQKMEAAQNGIRNSRFGAYVKKEIATDEVIDEMKKMDPNLQVSECKNDIERKVKKKMDSKTYGIASAGKTRQWNNQYTVAEWQLTHKNSIIRLYVSILCVLSICFCFCFVLSLFACRLNFFCLFFYVCLM